MKGFQLTQNGDIAIQANEIQMVQGNELLTQTVRTVLGTNQKEWFFDQDEGINFRVILTKPINEMLIRSEIVQGLTQVDESLTLDTFQCVFDESARQAYVTFTATNSAGETIGGESKWG